jgi:hypothetical protein
MEMMQFDAIENKQENPCHLPMDKGYAQILRLEMFALVFESWFVFARFGHT